VNATAQALQEVNGATDFKRITGKVIQGRSSQPTHTTDTIGGVPE
jgi:hypothetical protein